MQTTRSVIPSLGQTVHVLVHMLVFTMMYTGQSKGMAIAAFFEADKTKRK